MKMKLVSFVILCTLLLMPTIASAEVTNGNIGYGLTPGRLRTIVAAVVGLIGIVLAGLHLVNTTGGFGTGNGRAGAIVAIVVGLIGLVLAGLSLARSRRAG
ncbi:DUF6223 family protein [Paenibacillus sedimenti]|uniref:Integral membrane protein n=1 Tax=Paenibacillus sedimenti TaxID=2770274 RepID=A0A926QHN1_9BACL|nr:DUF6223 family protein [Paenibacillus sedimenti]MBD0378688.1 hypothetical protein [Paenibacillus sedimenti]